MPSYNEGEDGSAAMEKTAGWVRYLVPQDSV